MRRLALAISILTTACMFDDAAETTTTTQELGALVYLRAYWSPTNGDNALSTNPSFAPAGYSRYRIEGRIFDPAAPQPADTLPLYTWYGAARGDYMTTTNPYWAGRPGDVRNNYSFVRLEGYVHKYPVAGTLPLQLWWSPSRADNNTTSDPRFTVDTSPTRSPDYGFARDEGYVFASTTEQAPATRANFHWGTFGGRPLGERDVVVLLLDYADSPLRHAPSAIDSLVFGPSYPNVRDYTSVASQGRFTWSRGRVVGPFAYPDDPDTAANEASWHQSSSDGQDATIAFAHLRSIYSERKVHATANKAWTPGTGKNDSWNTFSVHDLNGGTLEDGDRIALKASNGMWLRESNGTLRADASSSNLWSAQFFIDAVTSGQVRNGAVVTVRSTSGRRLYEASATSDPDDDELVGANYESLNRSHFFTFEKALVPDIDRQVKAIIQQAAATHDFRVHDTDGNGVVDATELALLVVISAPEAARGAATRAIDNITLPDGLRIEVGQAASLGEDASFMSYAHELMHLAGSGHDLYGSSSTDRLSTMSATIVPADDDRRTFMLDPWHRIRFGWAEPEIQALNSVGGVSYQRASTIAPLRPLVLFDPREYDHYTKRGQYFVLEYRDTSRPYDQHARRSADGATGVVIWRVREQDGADEVTVQIGDNGRRLFGPTDGTVTLRYADGTESGFQLRFAPVGSTTMAVEWSDDGSILPRLDGGTSQAAPGEAFYIDGVFPVSPWGIAYMRNNLTGATQSASITSWSPWRVWFRTSTSMPAGGYGLYLSSGGTKSNRHQIVIAN